MWFTGERSHGSFNKQKYEKRVGYEKSQHFGKHNEKMEDRKEVNPEIHAFSQFPDKFHRAGETSAGVEWFWSIFSFFLSFSRAFFVASESPRDS